MFAGRRGGGGGDACMQVEACYEFLKARQACWTDDIRYDVSVSAPGYCSGRKMKGIYLREPHETSQGRRELSVSVDPQMTEGSPHQLKIDFEKHVLLVSTADWLTTPSALVLMASGRGFKVDIDPSCLTCGQMHHAEILGFDSSSEGDAPLFRIPVAVCKPFRVAPPPAPPLYELGTLALRPGSLHRSFVAVPPGATWAEATVAMSNFSGGGGTRRMLYMHALALVPHVPFSLTEHKPRWFAEEGSVRAHKFRVPPPTCATASSSRSERLWLDWELPVFVAMPVLMIPVSRRRRCTRARPSSSPSRSSGRAWAPPTPPCGSPSTACGPARRM
jgi:hypothetical protein